MKKRALFTGLSIGILATCPLVSCSENATIDPEDIIANVELASDHLSFTNANLSTSKGAEFKIRIFGETQLGDQVITSITQQTRDGEPGNYIKINDDSLIQQLEGKDTTFTLYFQPRQAGDKDVYSVDFSINFQIYRHDKVVSKLSLDNLIFVNGTAVPEDLFKITYVDDKKIVNSFKEDDVTKEQLKLCDVFILPKGTTTVSDDAFYDERTHQTTIPSTIKKIYLDYSEIDPQYEPCLQKIGVMSFRECNFNNHIILPESLNLIENRCFLGATNVTAIKFLNEDISLSWQAFLNISPAPKLDISIYHKSSGLPQGWQDNIFGDERGEEYNKITCYYHKSFSEAEWIEYFDSIETETSGWTFIEVSNN